MKHLFSVFFVFVLFCVCANRLQAQQKIGGSPGAVNPNAILELESGSRGLLLTRVSLTSTVSAAPLTAHVAGMVVYNTATAGTGETAVVPGIYVNDGTKWLLAVSSGSLAGAINLAPVARNITFAGLFKVGQTLTASYLYDDYEGDAQGGTLLRWYRSDDANGTNEVQIGGAAGLSYTLAAADVNKYVRMSITPGASAGTTPGSTQYTAYIGPVLTNLYPVVQGVTVTGTAKAGFALSSSYSYSDYENDVESGSTRQWYVADDAMGANESAIAGATGSNYVLGSGEVGKYLRVAVTPRAASGNSPGLTVYSGYKGPVVSNLAPEAQTVAITGTLGFGQVLSSTYTYSDAEGDVESGTVRQWYRADDGSGLNEAMIAGATGATYTLTATDMGKYLRVGITPGASTGNSPGVVAYSGYAGPVPVNNSPQATGVMVTGTATIGQALTSSYTYVDAESDPEVGTTRQWYRADNASGGNEAAIAGATGAVYTVTVADEGKYLRVGITPRSSAGISPGATSFSAYAGPVPGNQVPEARSVSISGVAAAGSVLTGSYTYFDADNDAQGSTTLQWYRADNNSGLNEAAIAGATASTYTLTAADANKYIRIGIIPVAAAGASPGATAYSAYTALIAANQAPVAQNVSISGPAATGAQLTANYTYADAEGNAESGTTFQWYRADDASGTNLTAISGATTASYLVQAGDAGRYIRVAITPKSNAGTTTGATVDAPYMGPIIAFACGTTTVTFIYRGASVTYGTIQSPTTGACFLDRNLGATAVATAFNTTAAYGHYFQWGRPDDGHQLSTSPNGTVGTLATSDAPGNNTFYRPNAAPNDWRSGNNNNRWATTPQGPCPAGWHVPTRTEWTNETGITNYNTAYSQLKLPAAGHRSYPNGTMADAGIYGSYWSSSVNSTNASMLEYSSTTKTMAAHGRAFGFSVRCRRD